MKESSSRSRNPSRCFSFWLLISVFLSMVAISTIAQTRSADSSNILPKRGDQNLTSFTNTPAYPEAGEPVQFTDGSQDQVISWEWDFGDGKTSNVRNPHHFYSKPGFYNVTLTTVGSFGKKRAKRTIGIMPPTDASFSYSPASPRTGQQVQFTDATSGSPTSWLWRFGDGTTSTSRNPSHAYRAPAPYTVTLLVGGISGPERASRTLTVSAATFAPTLTSSFAHSPGLPAPGQAIQFTDTSAGSPTSWYWDFNDGSTSTVQNPNHTFTAAGTYNVTLTITNNTGSTSTSMGISVGLVEVIKAVSPSSADVKSAIAKAKAGDTVLVPAGVATWNKQLVINQGIILKGAGADETVIICGYDAPYMTNPMDERNFLVVYSPASADLNESFRLSGFSFELDNRCQGILLENSSTTPISKMRIDHNKIQYPNSKLMLVKGAVYGVIDSNKLVGGSVTFYGSNEKAWNNFIFDFGTAENMYFEDNVYSISDTPHAGGLGGRYCVRHNTYNYINETKGLYPFCDMHGNQPGANLATMGAEVYENVVNVLTPGLGVGIFDQRGGKAIVFNNTINATGSVSQKVREEYFDSLNPPADSPRSGQTQHVSDSYFWGNKKNGVILVSTSVSQTVDYGRTKGLVPRVNVDFWDQLATFDGTSGIGVGLLANRPAKGTPGVGYWATDKNILFRWTADNKWEKYFTPYPYPHPLRNIL